MRFAFKGNRPSKAAAISYIDGYDLLSNSAIHMLHTTYTNPYNSVSSNIDIIEEHLSPDRVLTIDESVGVVRITDEETYDFETSEVNRLWYSSPFTYPYYNATGKYRLISKSVDTREEDTIVRGLITSNDEIIVMNMDSVAEGFGPIEVYVDGITAGHRLPHHQYSLDTGRGEVKIDNSLITGGIHTFSIRYRVITKDLEINAYPSQYKLEIRSAYEDVYYATLYSVEKASFSVKYKTTNIEGKYREVEETTIPTDIFISSTQMGDNFLDKKYVIIGLNKFRINNNTLRSYFARSVVQKTARIGLSIPQGIRTHEDWYMEVWNDSFYDAEKDLTYEVLESKDAASDGSTIREMAEIPVIISFNVVGITQTPIVSRNADGNITGIDVYINNSLVGVQDIDLNNRQIYITGYIRPSDDVMVRYKYKSYTTQLYNISLNPRKPSTDPYIDVRRDYLIFFVLPLEDLVEDSPMSVFVYKMKKESEFDTVMLRNNALERLESEEFKQYMEERYGTIINDSSNLHPHMLGVVYVEGRYNTDASIFYDMRINGGGLHPSEEVYDKIPSHDVWNLYDIGRWDGELFDTGGIIIVKVPNSVVELFADRFLIYDSDIVFDTEDQKDKAIIKARNYIRERIRKRRGIGRLTIVEFGD